MKPHDVIARIRHAFKRRLSAGGHRVDQDDAPAPDSAGECDRLTGQLIGHNTGPMPRVSLDPLKSMADDSPNDMMVYTADNPKLAAAVADVSQGTPPLEAFRKHDIAIPTSPPATPLDPGQLRFGSYGTYANGDIVVALDPQQVIIDGKVKPISSAATKPGFLGWHHPPTEASPGGDF